MIGHLHAERHACTDSEHLPNVYNPGIDLTACVCGDVWWRGRVGTWHSAQIREPGHYSTTDRYISGAVIGWDRYFLHVCGSDDVAPARTHLCREVEPMTAAEAHGRSA